MSKAKGSAIAGGTCLLNVNLTMPVVALGLEPHPPLEQASQDLLPLLHVSPQQSLPVLNVTEQLGRRAQKRNSRLTLTINPRFRSSV